MNEAFTSYAPPAPLAVSTTQNSWAGLPALSSLHPHALAQVARQKWSNAHYPVVFTQLILMSAYPSHISTSLSLASWAHCLLSLQLGSTTVFPTAAYAYFSYYLLLQFTEPSSAFKPLFPYCLSLGSQSFLFPFLLQKQSDTAFSHPIPSSPVFQ